MGIRVRTPPPAMPMNARKSLKIVPKRVKTAKMSLYSDKLMKELKQPQADVQENLSRKTSSLKYKGKRKASSIFKIS